MDTGCSLGGLRDVCSETDRVKIIEVIQPEAAAEPARCGVQIGVKEEFKVDAVSCKNHPACVAPPFLEP